MQRLGNIGSGAYVQLKLNPATACLKIIQGKDTITLPYGRINDFTVEDEVTLQKSGNTVVRALIGGQLFGDTGALVGAMSGKGNTNVKWIATLSYIDKNGDMQELHFLESAFLKPYQGAKRSVNATNFMIAIKKIIRRSGEAITEL